VVTGLCHKDAMSSATFYVWKAKFGGLEVSDAKRSSRWGGDGKLDRLLADAMLGNADLKDLR